MHQNTKFDDSRPNIFLVMSQTPEYHNLFSQKKVKCTETQTWYITIQEEAI
jgi:hypothetical protein